MSAYARRRLADELEGLDWPHRAESSAVAIAGGRWHIQRLPAKSGDAAAPSVVLAHGAGASTHSFRALAPLLAERMTVLIADLPGHGFSQGFSARAMSLAGMADALKALLAEIDFAPDCVVGHSAGAALLLEMTSRQMIAPKRIFSINGALKPMQSAEILGPLARLLFVNPLVPKLFAWRARRSEVANRLLGYTGSDLSTEGLRLYRALFAREDHVTGALGMMAGWDLAPLLRRLPDLDTPTTLVVAEDDAMVRASTSREAAKRLSDVEIIASPDGGHLLHETRPEFVADIILEKCGLKDI